MARYKTFSHRSQAERGELPDVYQYEEIPVTLRNQIIHRIDHTLSSLHNVDSIYRWVEKQLLIEWGEQSIGNIRESAETTVFNRLRQESDHERCLDVIELLLRAMGSYTASRSVRLKEEFDVAINDINYRFQVAGVGYQFERDIGEGGFLVRVDSQILHAETVKPVIRLLSSDSFYEGANSEFMDAHQHFRHGDYKSCVNECLKSFESLMKGICEKHNWEYQKGDTASRLIKVCFEHGLVPDYMQNQFAGLRQLLESGIPTVRNKETGHGSGVEEKVIPEHVASYAIYLTATNLLFLGNCEAVL